MVFHQRISPEIRAIIKLDKENNAKALSKKLGVSLAQVYRIKKQPLRHVSGKNKSEHKVFCRPEKLDDRSKRHLLRMVKQLRKTEPNWTVKRLMEVADVKNVSRRTVNRFLNKNGYSYLQARRKGLMSAKDRKARVTFAKKIVRGNEETLWTKKIAFYLDGVSFVYKRNPKSQAQAPKSRVWRGRSEGLEPGCVARGSKCGTGGKLVRMIVAISYDKGVVACVTYEKLDGNYFASFIRQNFDEMITNSGKNSRLWLQDGDPSQNSAAAKKAMLEVNSELFRIPPRSPDINPIENFFHLVRKQLEKDALTENITNETYEDFENRVKRTMSDVPLSIVNKTIESLPKRMRDIIKNKGKRLKY